MNTNHRRTYDRRHGIRLQNVSEANKQEESGRRSPAHPGTVCGPSHPSLVNFAVARGATGGFASGTVAGGGLTGITNTNMSHEAGDDGGASAW